LEVDEKYLPTVLAATRARVVALLNLSRDQMDRAAEIWLVARRWREALASATNCTVVANADDPLIAWAAAAAPDVIWVAAGQRWHEDSWCCPQCGSHLSRDELGWRCGECEFTRPPAKWVLDGSSVIAREPDGRDASWLWDVDYRVLRGRPVFVTGERRLDLAVRLEADQVPFELVEGVDDAVDQVSGGRLDVIANYTAFQQIRVFL